MLERCVGTRVCCRVRANPIGSALERLAGYLLERGHGRECIQQYLQAAEHFGRWVGTQRISPHAIDGAVVRRFLDRHFPVCHCAPPAPRSRICVRASLRHLLRCMGRQPVDSTEQVVPPKLQATLQDFDDYMREIAGLSEHTRLYRRRYAREFLQAAFGRGPLCWQRLTPALIMKFVADYVRRCSPATGQVAASALSGFLRFAQLRGFCDARLVRAVPWVPAWKRTHTAKSITAKQMRAVLVAFDRNTPTGRRDYAMALCMTDMGLRVGEVAGLCLEHLDWREGTVRIVHTKGRRARVLPLPRRAGNAPATYLRRDRPASLCRRIFLRLRAPRGTPVNKTLVRGAIRRACVASGLDRSFTGTHVLRHAAACRMHQRGVPVKQIADLLGHRSLDSTVVYAKANLSQLATAALPWPKGGRP